MLPSPPAACSEVLMVFSMSEIYLDIGRLIVQLVLLSVLVPLVCSLCAQYRDFREIEKRHKEE